MDYSSSNDPLDYKAIIYNRLLATQKHLSEASTRMALGVSSVSVAAYMNVENFEILVDKYMQRDTPKVNAMRIRYNEIKKDALNAIPFALGNNVDAALRLMTDIQQMMRILIRILDTLGLLEEETMDEYI